MSGRCAAAILWLIVGPCYEKRSGHKWFGVFFHKLTFGFAEEAAEAPIKYFC